MRIEVKAGLGRERFVIACEDAQVGTDELELDVSARYLFGRPAADLALAVEGGYGRVPFRSKRHPTFSFAPAGATGYVKVPQRKLKLDAEGRAAVPLAATLPEEPRRTSGDRRSSRRVAPGLWRLGVSATVTEDGGRSVSANASATVDTAGRHVGVRLGESYAPAGDPVRVEWVVVDQDDAPARGGRVEFTLDRIRRDWTWQEVNGRRTWRTIEREERVLERAFDMADDVPEGATEPASFELTCPAWGSYRLRARDAESGCSTAVTFYATNPAWGGGRMAVEHPERLEIVLDRKDNAPGSRAKALVRSPFPGTMLLALETDRVLDSRVIDMKTCEAEVAFDVPADLRGGAFVTATVVRAIDPSEKSWSPHRAMGVARLATRHEEKRLTVAVRAPAEARPGADVTVTVESRAPADAGRPGWVHLWAVDEGLLLVTSQRTPDPHGHFLARRRAGVWSSDCFGELLPDFERPESLDRIGAGSAGKRASPPGAEALRRNPIAAKRREPAVVWRAAGALGPDGSVEFKLAMPELTGAMRFMAVVVDGDAYGSAERRMKLTAPLLVEASWPRFAAPGDSFRVPVKLFNTTDAPLSAELALETEGPVIAEGWRRPGGVLVGPGASVLLRLDAKALSLGPVSARVFARAKTPSGEEVEARSAAELCVRPAGPVHSETRFSRARAGEAMEIAMPQGFLPGTARTTLTVGAEPLVEVRPAVRALIGYPYGCIEQTTSRLYAMVYAPQLLAKGDGDDGSDGVFGAYDHRRYRVEDMVQVGIERLWSMQTPSGGLGYWPGATKPHPWGTAYASFFLLQAKQAGFRVPERFVESLVAYLEGSLSSDSGLDANTRALYVNVLAGFGRPQHGWMARLAELPKALDIAGRANLAAAWFHAGRADRARDALPEGTPELAVESSTGGRITSRVRQEAVLLLALLEIDPDHDWIPPLAERVNAARTGRGYWGSTLENATALAALARYQATAPASADFTGTVALPGGGERTFSSAAPLTLKFDEAARSVRIASEGRGFVYVSAETEGLSAAKKTREYDRRIRVRRRWTDAKGRGVDPLAIRVGDLVNVETTLSAPGFRYGQWVHNVAVVDALAGGLEVENPRLATSTASARRGSSPCDHVEFLDDRVVVFTSISRQPRTFRYSLRAVAEGEYALPPVQASCMYDVSYASVNGSGRVRVGPVERRPEALPGDPTEEAGEHTAAAPG
ncbi:MAG: alpha-2-macroglobulin family protein, partial [Planctomycetota bacterium]